MCEKLSYYLLGDFMTRLRKLRESRGLTQTQIQALTGIDQSNYAKIEAGKRYMSVEQCRKLAIALDTSMDYLTGRTTNPKPPYPRAGDGRADERQ